MFSADLLSKIQNLTNYDDIVFCNTWYPQRIWLQNNNLNLENYPEDTQFLNFVEKYNLRVKANLTVIQTKVR